VAVRRFVQQVWHGGNVSAAEDFLAPDFVSHNTADVIVLGAEQYGQAVVDCRRAFPDLTVTLEDVFAAGTGSRWAASIGEPTRV
jgi:hypothetical protein